MSSNIPLEFAKTGFGLASQFMNACTSSWGKLIDASQPTPQFWGLMPELGKTGQRNDLVPILPPVLSVLAGNT